MFVAAATLIGRRITRWERGRSPIRHSIRTCRRPIQRKRTLLGQWVCWEPWTPAVSQDLVRNRHPHVEYLTYRILTFRLRNLHSFCFDYNAKNRKQNNSKKKCDVVFSLPETLLKWKVQGNCQEMLWEWRRERMAGQSWDSWNSFSMDIGLEMRALIRATMTPLPLM